MTNFLIEMDALHNLRAVDGYITTSGTRMRSEQIYRSGAWELMTKADRDWFANSIKTVIDLRHPDEVLNASRFSLGQPPATLIPLSIFPAEISMEDLTTEKNKLYGPGISTDRYLHYLKGNGALRFARGVELIAEKDRHPVLINCTAGKDRTGILVALVMDLLGIDDDSIGAEYERSNDGIEALIKYLESIGRRPQGTLEDTRSQMETPAKHILGFLEGVRAKYGSVEAMMTSNGVSAKSLETLRELLLD